MMFPASRRPRLVLAGFLALAAIAAGASGCSSSDEGSRQAGNLGTRVCIINNWTDTVSIKYTIKDTSTREGDLPPGEQSCAEGTMAWGCDVNGAIAFPELGLSAEFSAYNPWVQAPGAYINWRTFNGQAPAAYCDEKLQTWAVGDAPTWSKGAVGVNVKRLPDDQWKEFLITVQPS
jgi:hypothetical protein